MNIKINMWPVRLSCLVLVSLFFTIASPSAHSQLKEGPLQFFGYYQNAFQVNISQIERNSTSFMLQQLNLVAQKDLAPRFRSFVNFEFLNTFEGNLGWGSASLKEAWVRYDTVAPLN